MVRSLRVWSTLAGLGLVLTFACREVAVTAVEVASVEIEPGTATLTVGERRQFTARVEDSSGRQLSRDIFWNSSASQIATVTSTGEVLALGSGTATISATAAGVRGEATVVVSGEPVERVEVQPLSTSVQPGDSVQFTATAFASDGSTLLGRTVNWSVETATIASIRQTGWATGLANGTTRIFATVGGVRGQATLSVRAAATVGSVTITPVSDTVAAGTTTQLTATVRAGDNTIITPPPPVTWISSVDSVASVDANGLVTGDALGQATITATAGGASGQSAITVVAGPVASVDLLPAAASIIVGGRFQFGATGRDVSGNQVTGAATTWTSTNANVVGVDGNGLASGKVLGNEFVIATIAGIADSASVAVVPEPVATVAITPANPTVFEGDTVLLRAELRSAGGTTLTNRVVLWTSEDTTKARIISTGLRTQEARLIGAAAGTSTITATAEGESAQTDATVNQKPVASVQVQPGSLTVIVGGTGTLQAVLKAADGTVLTGRTIAWTSSRPTVATVSPAGVVTGVSADTATVIATAEGVSGNAKVTVSPKPVATVQIIPGADTVFTGDSIRFAVILRASDGSILTQRQVNWSSSNAAIARMNPATGDSTWVRGLQPGSITLTAVSEGVPATANVLVQLKPVATVTIVPATDTVTVGTSAPLRAVLRAADGTVLTGRPISWTSGSTNIATVAPATGDTTRVTGIAVGSATITASSGSVNGQATVLVEQAPVASVTVLPAVDTLLESATGTLTTEVRDAAGNLLTDRPVAWTSSSGAIAVTANPPLGLSAAIVAGTCPTGTSTCNATITATAEGIDGTANLFVQKPVATIAVTPPTATLNEGATAPFQADVRAADGTQLADRRVIWTSSIQGRLSIAATGPFGQSSNVTPNACPTGQTNCPVQLVATVGSISGAAAITILKPVATVTVSPATATVFEGDQAAFSAVATAADGTVINDRQALWDFTGNGVASISTSGQFDLSASVHSGACPQGMGSCTATITASISGVPGSATLTVRKRVATVDISPATVTLDEGATATLTATPRASDTTPLTDRAVTWSSSDPAVANVTGSGTFGRTGNLTAGTCPTGQPSCAATITATAEGVDGTSNVTVLKPITTIAIAPAADTLFEGDMVTLTATATAADGTVINNRPLTWSSADPSIATVTGSGAIQLTADVIAVLCPQGSGTCATTITAAEGSAQGQATITVVKQATTVAVALAADTLYENGATTAQAIVTASDGTVLTDRPVTWNANAFASITPTGPFGQDANISAGTCPTGMEECTSIITATVVAVGLQGTANLLILKPASSVTVLPASATLSVSGILGPQTGTFTAAATAADGTQILNRPITWCFVDATGNCTQTSSIVTLDTFTGPRVVARAAGLGSVTLRAQLTPPSGIVSAVATITVIL
ncbi:MAG: beta strand repeat-containing protein [Longimicrobiales bacterium]